VRRLLLLWILTLAGCERDRPSSTIDAPASACGCDADEICVQRFDGVCTTEGPVCIQVGISCPPNTCSPDCETALCGSGPYQCQNRPPCGTEVPGAFTCYGP
jgi:hypothetical protein